MWPLPLSPRLCLLPTFLRSCGYPLVETADNFQPNMRLSQITLGGFVSSALATNLYVSSYGGNITSVQLSALPRGGYSLKELSTTNASLPSPSWLTKDEYNDVVYCVDEGFGVPNGSVASYKTSRSGALTLIDRHPTIGGPVSSVPYNGGKALVIAH